MVYRLGDYTTPLYGDFNKPLGSLLSNQDSMESKAGFFRGSYVPSTQMVPCVLEVFLPIQMVPVNFPKKRSVGFKFATLEGLPPKQSMNN